MKDGKIVNQIKRCLVGVCDETCPYYHYEDNLCVSASEFLPIAEEFLNKAIKALEEIQQYRAIGTVEELEAKKEKIQSYKTQMSIYAEQHKIILASDVLDMLEELEWSEGE